MKQLDIALPPPQNAPAPTPAEASAHITLFLSHVLAKQVRLTLTDNRSTMVSYRQVGNTMQVRLHRMFISAGAAELRALALYLHSGSRRAGRVIDAFIDAHITAYRATTRRDPATLQAVGRFHDLNAILQELNQNFFHQGCRARITWGAAQSRGRRRSIQLGCYVHAENLIRMHACLDQDFVPRYYVAWVVFHEMLHDIFGVERHGSRRVVHPPAFTAIETTYPDYERCKVWEKQHLPQLLRYRPSVAKRP